MQALAKFWQGIDHPAWVRFFVGLGGLVLAFTAALFSTVFRQQGNELATAISASVALLTAGFVGLYTVPYLAKRTALEGFREVVDYDITREGLAYLAATLIIGVAALNTNNNLLFIVVSAMLSAVLVSGVASALILRGLRLEITLPGRIFARQSMLARVTLHNRYRMASFSVAVVPPKEKRRKRFYWEKGVFGWPPKRPPHLQWFRVADLKLKSTEEKIASDAILRSTVYFPYITARGSAHADVELHFAKRGLYTQKDFGISTRFPFSFLRKTRKVPLQREIIVYPSVAETDELFQVLPMITGEFEAFQAGRGHDLYRIREHQPGDSARLVDWKATAKSQSLKVREFTREDERKLRIVFDNPAPGVLTDAEYEAAVELAASLAWHFADSQTQLAFVARGYSGSQNVIDFLRFLALVQPESGESVLRGLGDTPDYNILITSEPRGTVPTQLWASSYILFMQRSARK
ncbi:MAG: DUF58 domain-containing protein [Acidobacteriales bacterium]|nr:DUF58 domain-containing protein [Terriglobales bacterium]